MIKRIVCSLAALMVLTSSVFSWDAYSFTGVYDVASASAPVLYSDSSSDSSIIDLMDYTGWTGLNTTTIAAYGDYSYVDILSPSTRRVTGIRANSPGIPYVIFTGETNFYNSVFVPSSILYPWSGYYYDSFFGPSFVYTFSEPYPTSVSLDGLISPLLSVSDNGSHSEYFARDIGISVNGSWPTVYYPNDSGKISLSEILVDYSGIQTITFWPRFTPYSVSTNRDVEYNFAVFLTVSSNTLKLGILDDNSALNGFNSEAQDSINDHESIESEWTGSMTTNFDALDMDNFTFPSGLVSGFGLITGIFQDLWNGMGEYKILYVFPLTLGVALLLIGRISKFSGGQSSSRSDRGNDDA